MNHIIFSTSEVEDHEADFDPGSDFREALKT